MGPSPYHCARLSLFLWVVTAASAMHQVDVPEEHHKTGLHVSQSMGQYLLGDRKMNNAETTSNRKSARFTRESGPNGFGPKTVGDLILKTLRKRKIEETRAEYQTPFCGIEEIIPRARRRRGPALPRIDSPDKARRPNSPRRVYTDKTLTVELAIFADYELWNRYWEEYHDDYTAEAKLKDFVATTFSNIQILYNHPTFSQKLVFKIVKFEILKYQPYALSGDRHQNGDAQMYLDAFCMYQYKMYGRTWDQSFLFTGYDIHRNSGTDKSISGLSRLAGACDPYNSCVLVEGHDFTSSFVAAHELGHGFGMKHDDDTCSNQYIMSGLLGPAKTSWSTCSMRELQRFVDDLDDSGRNCLRESTGASEVLPLDLWRLPGQKYDGDKQCSVMYGDEYTEFVPKDDFTSDGPCAMIWCGKANFSRVITAHPALEGTYCGDYRYCQKGRCTSWSNSPPAEEPRVVHGGWSEWSRFMCTPCNCAPFTGGLAIVPITRTCTNPKPSNGGVDCTGSDVRGLVCQSQCPATGDTVKAYIKRKCDDVRQGVGKNDGLSGDGVQLLRSQERACKVFCAMGTGTWYRFYGDLLPDGTPCGKGRYCAAGKCLKLLCENTTLVSDESMCPSSGERCGTATIEVSPRLFPTRALISTIGVEVATNESEWNSWSPCSVTCGKGHVSRRRSCTPDGKCPKDGYVETRSCDQPACKVGTHENDNSTTWGAWSKWSACSVTCGQGVQARTRICLTVCKPADGNARESKSCNQPACAEWGHWSQWTECTGNVRTRIRSCYGTGKCNGWTTPEMSREVKACGVTNIPK